MRVIVIVISIALGAFANASGAASRDEVLGVLQTVVSPRVGEAGAEAGAGWVWANKGDNLPIEEGTPITFHFQSREDVHLTAVYLDADGNLLLLYPAPEGTTLRGGVQLDLLAGEATTPYGLESLFVVASDEPISRRSLGIDSTDTFAVLGPADAVRVAIRLSEIVSKAGRLPLPGARVDLHIVPASSTTRGYTKGGIIQYFTEATRSLHRPKLALDINFETNSAALADSIRNDLDVVGAALMDERLSDASFMLVGHTDHRGDLRSNQVLSEARAESARQYLVEKFQIAPERLQSMGHGETKPMMKGRDEVANRRNRRVELELIP